MYSLYSSKFKLSLYQNPIIIYNKFNSDFKRLINFEWIQWNMNPSSSITLFNKLTKHIILHAFKGPFGLMLSKNAILKICDF
jgi:hypothetical protein